MKIKLPGQEIAFIRNAFGMSQEAFACVLAVHPATVRRWEATPHVSVDGVAANVLAVARQRLHGTPPPTSEELRRAGDAVVGTLAAAGALLALALLINWLAERKR